MNDENNEDEHKSNNEGTCSFCGKKCFTVQQAREVINHFKIVRRHVRDHAYPMRMYKCTKCGYWHLTSQKPSDKKYRYWR